MKKTYRGCEITVTREQSMGGWDEVYWSALTEGSYEIDSGFGGGTVWEMYGVMKKRVDEFLDEYGGGEEKHSEMMTDFALTIGGLK